MDDVPRPVTRLRLKPRDVTPIDAAARPGDGTAISVQLIHRENELADRKPAAQRGGAFTAPKEPGRAQALESSMFKPKEVTRTDPPSVPGGALEVDVHEMLRRNHAAAVRSGPELIAMPVRRRSRRNRDFALILGAAGATFGVLAVIFRNDRQVIGLCMFGIVFATVILTWILYGIMDNY